MKVGAKLRNYGPGASVSRVLEEAQRAEAAGFDSVWLSDHIVMPRSTSAAYPYAPGGKVTWELAEPWLEPVAVLAALAATTRRVALGTAVLVVGLREPVNLAKQLACIDQLADHRLVLGVGDGWLKEELELFGCQFEGRREHTDTVLERMGEVWSGELAQHQDGAGLRFVAEPRPSGQIPVLLGGSSDSVFARIASHGHGWLPLHHGAGAAAAVRGGLARIAAHERPGAPREGDDGTEARTRVVLNAGRADEIVPELEALGALGVSEVLVDADFDRDDGPLEALARMHEATGARHGQA